MRRFAAPARLRRDVLGGSGLFMSAAAVGIGQPVHLVSHIGCDADGDRIRAWAIRYGVTLSPARRGSRSVHLVEDFIDGHGIIVAGTPDPGPSRAQLKVAVDNATVLLIGDTSTQALSLIVQLLRYRRRANLPTPTVVANLSAATIRAWPQARALWGMATVVTIGEQELLHLAITHSEARQWLADNATLAITNGLRPVMIYSADERVKVDVPRLADPIDTMGAGDAFAVTLMHNLAQGLPLHHSAERAIHAAQIMCQIDSVEEVPQGNCAASGQGPHPP